MSTLKVIVVLLTISATLIDSRALREKRQVFRSSAYSGAYGLGNYLNLGYGLGWGNNLYPIGNYWYQQGVPQYPYNYQYGFNAQQYPYGSNYGYPWGSLYGASAAPNSQMSAGAQVYVGQSYIPSSFEWLPLPGRHGGQLPGGVIPPKMPGNFAQNVRL